MGDPVLQNAYDNAAAVFSRSFRFVEWKFIIAAPRNSVPFGDRGEPNHKSVKKIDREKWIYVFRHDVGAEYAPIKEEIRIEANGEMAATPFDELEKELKKRGDPVSLGKSMCLPRRIFGKPQAYRFFASRVQLPLAQIKELEKKIYTFAPATNLEPGNNTSVIEKDGELLVPVVDPITVMLHLHAAFVAAADDVINYTAAHTGLSTSKRKAVERRRKKHLLATLLKGISDNDNTNTFVNELKSNQEAIDDFVVHYEEEVQWRVGRRDRLAGYLIRWLESEALTTTAAAYKGSPMALWVRFLIPWSHAITRFGETPAGRDYLSKLFDDKGHFVHTYVWPKGELTEDQVQAVRKGGMTILEAWKTIAEFRILLKGGEYVNDIVGSFYKLKWSKESLKLTEEVIKEGVGLTRTIRTTKVVAPAVLVTYEEPLRHFAFEPRALGSIIESVNLIFAVSATMAAMKSEDPRVRELAIIGLVGSSLDAASAISSLFKNAEKAAAVLGFVSGIIDVYLGVVAMNQSFHDGDQDSANGAFLTAAGSTMGTSGVVMGLLAVPGGQIIGVIGLAVVAIGFIYKAISGDPPIQRFFNRCTWGKDHLLAGGGDWTPTRFETWTGEKEFDYQLEALLNILCKIEISFYNDDPRYLQFKMGWLPPNAKLAVTYEEKWEGEELKTLRGEVMIADQGASTEQPAFSTAVTKNVVHVRALANYLSKKHPNVEIIKGYVSMVKGLERSVVSGRLLVTFDGTSSVKIPHDRPAAKTLVEQQMILKD